MIRKDFHVSTVLEIGDGIGFDVPTIAEKIAVLPVSENPPWKNGFSEARSI